MLLRIIDGGNSMRKINIAIMLEGFGGKGVGGAAIASLGLIKNLDKKKFNLFCIYFEDGIFTEDAKTTGAKLIKVDSKLPHMSTEKPMIFNLIQKWNYIKQMYFILKNLNKIISIIKRNDIDIIHTMHLPNYIISSIASHLTGINHIRTQPNYIRTKERLNAKTFKWTPFAKWTDFFITYQFYARDDLHKLGVPLNKIYVQKNRIDIYKNIAWTITSDIRQEFGWDPSVKIVCSMSRLVPLKGLEIFVEMIPFVVREYGNVRFLILGEGPLKEKLISRCNELGISDYVRFPGFRVDKESITRQITLGVYPTDDTAGMVTIPMFGRVLISKHSESMAEYIVDGVTGYLINGDEPLDYANAVLSILKDEALRNVMESNIIKYYSFENSDYYKNSVSIRELEEIIIKLISKNENHW